MPSTFRSVQRTALLVGGGHSEIAFLYHLRSLYSPPGCGVAVTLKSAYSPTPANIIATAIRQSKNAHYDVRIALLSSGEPWSTRLVSRARTARVSLVAAQPCFEGFLLDVLAHEVPPSSEDCKAALLVAHQHDWTSSITYSNFFPQMLLDERTQHVQCLRDLISATRGHRI